MQQDGTTSFQALQNFARSGAEAELHYQVFDLLHLGMGPDGHTASLFPGRPEASASHALVIPIRDSPKPPPERVSLSAPRLSRARKVLFLVSGESKRQALTEWRSGKPLPAAAVRPANGVDVLLSANLL